MANFMGFRRIASLVAVAVAWHRTDRRFATMLPRVRRFNRIVRPSLHRQSRGRAPGRTPACLVVAALVASAHAQTGARPQVSTEVVIDLPAPVAGKDATHALALGAWILEGAGWRAEDVASALGGAAGMLAQCRVAVDALRVATVRAERRYATFFTAWSRALVAALSPSRPAIFFVADTRQRPAFDAEAIGRGNSRTRPELADTVWVVHGARDLPVVIAHELVHVLADSGEHSALPGNLMGEDTDPSATALTAEQCERVRSAGETHGLLRRLR